MLKPYFARDEQVYDADSQEDPEARYDTKVAASLILKKDMDDSPNDIIVVETKMGAY